MADTKKSVFETLVAINCNDYVEKKKGSGLTYLSWAWAWRMVKINYPGATYTIYETSEGRPYFDDSRTAWVKTGVTIEGLEHIEYLPILDAASHASLPLNKVTSWDVNKAIQRSLTKACARHGLGLYIYAGEDLPDEADQQPAPEAPAPERRTQRQIIDQVADEPERPTNIDPDTYWKVVAAYASGRMTKSGGDYRSRFIEGYHPTPAQVRRFDADVDNYKAANNLK